MGDYHVVFVFMFCIFVLCSSNISSDLALPTWACIDFIIRSTEDF